MRRRGIGRTQDGNYRVELPDEERDVLAALPGQLREALDAGEPTLYRLFPPAHADDDAANEDYARLVGPGLVDGKLAALAELERTAHATAARRGRARRLARRGRKPPARPRHAARRDGGELRPARPVGPRRAESRPVPLALLAPGGGRAGALGVARARRKNRLSRERALRSSRARRRHRRLHPRLERGAEPPRCPRRAPCGTARRRRARDRRRLDRCDRRGGARRTARPLSRSARTEACARALPRGTRRHTTAATPSAAGSTRMASTPSTELVRLLELVGVGDRCDVAVGSRFAKGDGYGADRYEPSPARRFGIGLLQKAMHIRLGRPFHDPTSGMAAVNRCGHVRSWRGRTRAVRRGRGAAPAEAGRPPGRGGRQSTCASARTASRSCRARRR